jgi:putative ABC transport system permease protein
MIRVALRGLAGRKLRAILTALAVVLGVSMISGTYVLTDTINKAFDNLFTDSYAGTDVVISGVEAFETDFGLPPSFPEGLLDDVRELPEVEAAAGGIQDLAQLTDKKGEPIQTGGAPTLGFGIDTTFERFNPLVLTAGDWADGPDEVVIDAGTAAEYGFDVGDTIEIRGRGALEPFQVVGIARFGSVDNLGGATAAYFDLPTAQRVFDKTGELDGIQIATAAGVAPEDLTAALSDILPENVEAKTSAAQAEEDQADVTEFTSFIRYFLLAFGGIALFVGAFVIFNTLSITVAQRTREFATLRTIGASRRQILVSVLLEAFVIGVLASLVGLFAGLGLAEGLNAVFVAFDIDLPSTDTVFAGRTIAVSLIVGTAITLFAGLFPAVRATKVAPIAAVREGAALPKGWVGRHSTPIAFFTAGGGLALVLLGMFRDGFSTTGVLLLLGVGVLVLFVGIALVSPKLVRPLAAIVGWPASRIGGPAGRLARENATRNPSRTAATAAALMIGLALITFVAVLASGLTSSVEDAIERQVSADYVVQSESNFAPFEPATDGGVASVEGVRVSPVRGDFGRTLGEEWQVTGVDPATIASVYDFVWIEGDDGVATGLTESEALIESRLAEDEGVAVGDSLTIEAANGRTLDVTIAGIYDAPSFWQMLGQISVPIAAFDATFERPQNLYTFVEADGGVSLDTTAALEAALDRYPGAQLETRASFTESQSSSINQLLSLLYVLLALSVIVSLFGMVNTLVLSVFERTREIGMLRAVGMTRRQARRMIRHESIITALIGAALGLPLGVALAAIVTTRLSDEGLTFSVPVGTILIFVVVAILAGIVAAVFPARRAARLNVLNALQYE